MNGECGYSGRTEPGTIFAPNSCTMRCTKGSDSIRWRAASKRPWLAALLRRAGQSLTRGEARQH